MQPRPGTVLGGDVRVVAARGDLFEAQLTADDRRCWLRWFPLGTAPSEAELASLIDEVRGGGPAFEPVLAAGYDAGAGGFYVAIAPPDGVTLEAAVQERGALGRELAGAVLCGVADALLALDELGTARAPARAHGRLLAESIYLDASEPSRVTLVGLGEARLVRLAPPWQRPKAMLVAPPWVDPQWSAPEHAELDYRARSPSDVFSLALLTFFALTGHSPWGKRAPLGAYASEPPALQVRAAELGLGHLLPPELAALLSRALSPELPRRPALGAFRDELGALLGVAPRPSVAQPQTVRVPDPPPPEPPRPEPPEASEPDLDDVLVRRRRDVLATAADAAREVDLGAIDARKRRHEAVVLELLGHTPDTHESLSEPCLSVAPSTCLSRSILDHDGRPSTCLSIARQSDPGERSSVAASSSSAGPRALLAAAVIAAVVVTVLVLRGC